MNKTICLLPGDGIGPEILAQGAAVLAATAQKFGHTFDSEEALIGGAAVDATGSPLPEATVEACRKADAVYLAAVGGPKWDSMPPEKRPEKGLLGIRKALGLFANLRPALLLPELAGACLLRPDVAAKGLDLIVVRELTGDVYFGEPRGVELRGGRRTGFNTMIYDEEEIRRIARVAFETARRRRGKVCSVEKSNVLETSRLWKEVVLEVHKDYADVELSHMYVDQCGHAAGARPVPVRRDSHRQYFRRHPFRRGLGDYRFPGHVALGFPGRVRAGPVRARPRLSAGHRGPGQGQSPGDHSFRGHAFAPGAAPRRRSGLH